MGKRLKLSKEHKRRISETLKGFRTGFKHSEETKQKIREKRALQVMTPESNRKRSETLKGRKFPKESLKKMSNHAKKRFSNKKNHPNYGKPLSKECKKNISKSLKGRKLEDLHTKEKAEEIRTKIKEARSKQIFPIQDTSIEIKIQNFLKQLGIEFYTHHQMKIPHSYQCDIFIPFKKLIIECDGIYWHNFPTGTETDIIRNQELRERGFRVLRFWGTEVNAIKFPEFEYKLEKIQ